VIISNCRKIVGGSGEGKTLVTTQPINFLTMVDAKNGAIAEPQHELHGRSLKGAVLVLPYAIGSSVGAYAIYSLKEYGTAPSAVICSKADIIIASGCAIANIPVVDLPNGTELHTLKHDLIARVEADAGRVIIMHV
jgi:predicted aconitase with swiveling domain